MPSEGDDHAASNALWECSYGCWYPQYADLAPASRVIELDQGVVDFLHEDGLVLHEQSDAVSRVLSEGAMGGALKHRGWRGALDACECLPSNGSMKSSVLQDKLFTICFQHDGAMTRLFVRTCCSVSGIRGGAGEGGPTMALTALLCAQTVVVQHQLYCYSTHTWSARL